VRVVNPRVRPLEVEAVRDLLVGLVDRVLQLDLVDFGDDIERGHIRFPAGGYGIIQTVVFFEGQTRTRMQGSSARQIVMILRSISGKRTLTRQIRWFFGR